MKKSTSRPQNTLDKRLSDLKPIERFAAPPKGWVRAIRDAIGMSGAQLARRLGVTPQSVADLEKSEAAGKASIDTLRRAAAAMDCALVYALVPRTSLEEMVRSRARAIALRELGGVAHSMAIENQKAPDDLEARVEQFIRETLKNRDLWDER